MAANASADEVIIQEICDSNEDGLRKLLEKYGGKAKACLLQRFHYEPDRATLVSTALSDASLRIWQNPYLYDPSKGSLPAYFLIIADRCCRDLCRAEKRHKHSRLTDDVEQQICVLVAQRLELQSRSEKQQLMIDRMNAELGKLSPLQQAAVKCRGDDAALADEFKTTVNVIQASRSKALRKLRANLNKDEDS